MKPTEELFDLKNDPLELRNLADSIDQADALQEMRLRYENQCKAWKQEAVKYNDYERYGVLFDRNVPLAHKEHLKKKPKRSKPKTTPKR